MWGVTFEDFNSVKKKLDILTKQINLETSKGIEFDIDTNKVTEIIGNLSKMAKQNIQILPDGQIITLTKFNQELGKTVSLKKNLTTGDETLSLNVDNDKIRKDTDKMYADLFKQQEALEKERENQYKALFDQAINNEKNLEKEKQKIRDSEWKEAEIKYKEEQNFINASQSLKQKSSQESLKQSQQEASEENRLLEEKYKSEQEFINTSQKLKQKSYQESLKQTEKEAQISNKLLEEQYKESQSEKEQLVNAQKLVDYEKQRLNLKLESIQANRKDLVDNNSASKINGSINSLDGRTIDEVKEKSKQLSLELQKLDQNARMKGLQVGNKNIMSLGESIKSTATKLGIFVSTAMVLNEVQQTIRNSVNYIKELDKAMVDLKKVTDETSQTYGKFLDNMHNVALRLGTQSNAMVEAATNWAKTGKTLEEASKLAENTVLLTKVGDIDDVDTAQSYMVAPLKSFNIEAERSIELIDKYNNLSNNMATETRDMGAGLNIASNSLAVAGNNLEQSLALIATGTATTQQSGETIGNALKSISLRLATFKDEDGELIPQFTESLKQVGVQAVDSAGQIRSTFDILKDLGKVYEGLDKNLQLKLAQQVGGKHQANVVASILTNVDELERAYGLATNSAGSALDEFEKYQEGIEYALDRLKEQVNGLYTSFLDGGLFKGLVNGSADAIGAITEINNTLGTIPTIVVSVVGAMTIFNSKFRETTQVLLGLNPVLSKVFVSLNNHSSVFASQASSYTKQISFLKDLAKVSQEAGVSTSGFGKELLNLNIKLATTTFKMVATKVAVVGLQLALNTLVSFGISFVISKLGELVDKLIITQNELKQLNQDSLMTMSGNQELIASVEGLIKKEKELEDKINGKGNTYEQQKQYRTELLSVQKQIADILPKSADGFDSEGNKIANNTEKVLENLDAKKKLAESEALKAIENNSNYDTKVKAPQEYEKMKKQLADMQEAYKNNETYMGSEVDSKWLAKIEKKVNEYESAIKIMSSAIESLRTAGWDEDRIAQEIFKNIPLDSAVEFYNTLISVTDEYTQSLESASESQEEFNDSQNNTQTQTSNVSSLQKAYESLGYSISDVKDKMSELGEMSVEDANTQLIKDATSAYGEAISKTKELQGVLDSINKEQAMTPDLVMKLADLYPELGSRITSVADVQEFLNQKISESVEAQANAYNQMVANDNEYYSSKVKNNDAIQENFNALLSAFVTNSGESYSTDLDNYSNLTELKADLTNQFGETVANFITNFVTSQSSGYDIDLNNTVSWAKAKSQILQQLNKNITRLENRLSDSVSKINSMDITDDNMTDAMRQYRVQAQKLAQLKSQEAEIQTEFSKYSAGFQGYSPTFSGGSFNSGSGKGSSGSGSDGSSSAGKEIQAMEKLSDRYGQVDDALTKLNNELEKNKTIMENANDEEKIKLLDKQVSLINQQRTAYENLKKEKQSELSELKSSLANSGFNFGSDGSITNENNRLDNLVSWANSQNSEEIQKNVKAIYENVERYNELLLKEIPKTENEILNLKNTTINAQKEIADILEKQKDKYITKLEDETDGLKKELKKRKDLMNKTWETEDYEDKLKEKQNNLVDLQSQLQDAMRMSDDELIKSIKKQIESAQSEINTFIRDNERDEANDRFDEELDKLDEGLNNKIEEINNKLSKEQILTLVQNGVRDLSSVLNDVGTANKSISTTFTSVGTIIRDEWLTNLDEVINKLKLVENFEFGSGRSVGSNAITSKAKSIGDVNFEINLTVEGGSKDQIPEIKKLLKETKEEIYKEISDVL